VYGRALGRRHHVEIGQPRPDHVLVAGSEQFAVDDVADQRAGDPSGNRAGRPEHRACSGARDGKNEGCHHCTPVL
jgi:hypothetical protein